MGMRLLFVCVTVLLTLCQCVWTEECIKDSSCACRTSKGKIDLSPLSNPSSPRFTAPGKKGNTSYTYNPCDSIATKCGVQKGDIAVCQTQAGSSYCVGLQSLATFSGDPDTNSLVITYSTTDDRMTVVKLSCSDSEGVFTATPGETTTNRYSFELSTKYACLPKEAKSGLSTGSVLLIIVFVLLLVYFIGGMIFLKFVRGAQGIELIPNYEFWKALPGLIRDGILFVFRGCKTDSTYSQI